jgi:ABC-type dipeptide/oligopeptide/nickel transport system permease subunit
MRSEWLGSRLGLIALRFPLSFWFRPLAMAGLFLVGGWAVAAILAPWVSPYSPLGLSSHLLAPPNGHNLLGTDELGRDILSRVLWGARVSLPLAILLVVGILLVGSILGGLAGYFGGVADTLIMRLADLVFAFPVILLAMTVTAAIGPGLKNAVIAVIAVAWPSYARVVRGSVTSLVGADYVSASRLLGASSRRALMTDVLPNIAGPILALVTLDIGRAVLLLSALSFLGLGAQPPTAEWGSMVATGIQFFNQWWVGLFPGLAILTATMGFTLLGDSLRDALDPKASWSRGGQRQ